MSRIGDHIIGQLENGNDIMGSDDLVSGGPTSWQEALAWLIKDLEEQVKAASVDGNLEGVKCVSSYLSQMAKDHLP